MENKIYELIEDEIMERESEAYQNRLEYVKGLIYYMQSYKDVFKNEYFQQETKALTNHYQALTPLLQSTEEALFYLQMHEDDRKISLLLADLTMVDTVLTYQSIYHEALDMQVIAISEQDKANIQMYHKTLLDYSDILNTNTKGYQKRLGVYLPKKEN